MVLVFTTPDFSATGKLVWAYATYILFSFGYTMVNIPMTSIVPSLSESGRTYKHYNGKGDLQQSGQFDVRIAGGLFTGKTVRRKCSDWILKDESALCAGCDNCIINQCFQHSGNQSPGGSCREDRYLN